MFGDAVGRRATYQQAHPPDRLPARRPARPKGQEPSSSRTPPKSRKKLADPVASLASVYVNVLPTTGMCRAEPHDGVGFSA